MTKKGRKQYAPMDAHNTTPIPYIATDKIPAAFPAIDNDLAAENLENDFDMTAADLQDL